MSSIQRWVNRDEITHLTNMERLACVLYIMGAATKEQLSVVTGWDEIKVRDLLRALRNSEPMPESLKKLKQTLAKIKKGEVTVSDLEQEKLEHQILKQTEKLEKARDQWLISISSGSAKDPNYYTLGRKGIEMVKEIRNESFTKFKFKETPKRQMRHFYGINEVLCRLRRKGIMETDWLCGKEVRQEIGYQWNRKYKGEAIPSKPDAQLKLGEYEYFIEFDTGTESPTRLQSRMKNYFKLYSMWAEAELTPLPPHVLWVTVSESRKQKIAEIGKQALRDFLADNQDESAKVVWTVPEMYSFVEGEDTKFICDEIEADPFCGG